MGHAELLDAPLVTGGERTEANGWLAAIAIVWLGSADRLMAGRACVDRIKDSPVRDVAPNLDALWRLADHAGPDCSKAMAELYRQGAVAYEARMAASI
jgi:hypothetical protein